MIIVHNVLNEYHKISMGLWTKVLHEALLHNKKMIMEHWRLLCTLSEYISVHQEAV